MPTGVSIWLFTGWLFKFWPATPQVSSLGTLDLMCPSHTVMDLQPTCETKC